jgi:hypothetical protein
MREGHLSLHGMANLLSIDAVRQARAGHWDHAVSDVATIQAMARHSLQANTLIYHLVALILDDVADDALQAVAGYATTEAQLQTLPLQPRSWHESISRQFPNTLALAQEGVLLEYVSGTATHCVSDYLLMRYLFLDDSLETTRNYRHAMALVPATDWSHAGQFGKRSTLPPGPASIGLAAPFFTGTYPQVLHGFVRRELDDIGLVALRYRLRTGHLPASFDEVITAGLLPAVPTSPWDGKPMALTTTPAEAVITCSGYAAASPPPAFHVPATQPIWQSAATKPAMPSR